ncbi:MAG: hypothetical protein H6684_08610 [Deltaproteobacteria bacterium]|nr:hypothetical protein [Deltaproteobacteria bacterium]
MARRMLIALAMILMFFGTQACDCYVDTEHVHGVVTVDHVVDVIDYDALSFEMCDEFMAAVDDCWLIWEQWQTYPPHWALHTVEPDPWAYTWDGNWHAYGEIVDYCAYTINIDLLDCLLDVMWACPEPPTLIRTDNYAFDECFYLYPY